MRLSNEKQREWILIFTQQEAWQILSHKTSGLRAMCVVGINKINPFASLPDWVGCLNHLCVTQFVPSYMSWGDMFSTDKVCVCVCVCVSVCV